MGIDHPLPVDVEHTLGTDKYVFRMYVDTRVVRPELLEGLQDADLDADRAARGRVERLRAEHPAAFVNMAVTYYTGMVDTVAHIPDRCMVADGYEPTRVGVMGYGEFRPAVPNDGEENRAKNRRVEIFLVEKGSTVSTAEAPNVHVAPELGLAFARVQ